MLARAQFLGRLFVRALKKHGLRDTLAIGGRNLRGILRPQTVGSAPRVAEPNGLDMASPVHLASLDIPSPNALFGNRYQPSPVSRVRPVLAALPIRAEDAAFIDIGSGKGPVLLLAAEFPFRRIIGVEFSPDLHAIAQRNLAAAAASLPFGRNIELVCEDACAFAFPPEPLVVYMYHPFQAPVMQKFLERLQAAIAQAPARPVYVIYWNPLHRDLLDAAPFLTPHLESPPSGGCDGYVTYYSAALELAPGA